MTDAAVYIGVGSNIDPERNIPAALELLARHVAIEAVSRFYRSKPLERPEQPAFVNGAVRVRTHLGPRPLKFDVLRPIESALGRVRSADAYAARTIDLDILLFDAVIINEPDLRIPDPDIGVRPFIAVPLLDLDPDLVLPDTGELLARAPCLERSDLVSMDVFTQRLKARLNV